LRMVIASGRMLAGLVVAHAAGIRDWSLAVPPLVGVVVGIAIYLTFPALDGLTLDGPDPLWVILVGQAACVFVATWLTGYVLTAAEVATILGGAGSTVAIAAQPEPQGGGVPRTVGWLRRR
jgi:hypothetical protein